MAWKISGLFSLTIDEGYTYIRDIIDVEQIKSTAAGSITLRVYRHGTVKSGDTPSGSITFRFDGRDIVSRKLKGAADEYDRYFDFEDTVTVELPADWAGQTIRVIWREENKSLNLGAVAPRSVSISKGDSIETLTLYRTATPSGLGTVGELKGGDIAYDTDRVRIDYTVKPGYEAAVSFGGKAVQSGDEVTVDGSAEVNAGAAPKATLSIYQGGRWRKYLIYVRRGGAWKLHQAHIRNGGAWHKYY